MTAEIKRAARQGNQDVVKTLAKQLVQLRNHEAKLMGFTANMSSMQMQMTVRCGTRARPLPAAAALAPPPTNTEHGCDSVHGHSYGQGHWRAEAAECPDAAAEHDACGT